MIIEITEHHIRQARQTPIYRDAPYPTEADPVITALHDAGHPEAHIESHSGLDGMHRDWKVYLNGKCYQMTLPLKFYYRDALAYLAQRTKPATITLDDDTMSADVRVKRYRTVSKFLPGEWI